MLLLLLLRVRLFLPDRLRSGYHRTRKWVVIEGIARAGD